MFATDKAPSSLLVRKTSHHQVQLRTSSPYLTQLTPTSHHVLPLTITTLALLIPPISSFPVSTPSNRLNLRRRRQHGRCLQIPIRLILSRACWWFQRFVRFTSPSNPPSIQYLHASRLGRGFLATPRILSQFRTSLLKLYADKRYCDWYCIEILVKHTAKPFIDVNAYYARAYGNGAYVSAGDGGAFDWACYWP